MVIFIMCGIDFFDFAITLTSFTSVFEALNPESMVKNLSSNSFLIIHNVVKKLLVALEVSLSIVNCSHCQMF